MIVSFSKNQEREFGGSIAWTSNIVVEPSFSCEGRNRAGSPSFLDYGPSKRVNEAHQFLDEVKSETLDF